ncbi:MAG: OmpA family protein [Algoriphagus sp.]|uniref:OmpA family protein n=1 Tax=Algoriphagus sp. TaxID=1872435 RepID=UPI0027374C5A|nr:OmpA family protein [Algoriphagus sp.]MDP3470273.1 OmpA family protein [Algoriphagus sp.]
MKISIFKIFIFLLVTSCSTSKKILKEADSHFESFEYDLAINSYKQYFGYHPTNEVAYKLAISCLKKREFKEAEYWYTWYKQTGQMSVGNLYELAEIYIGNSKFEDARLILIDIVALDDSETSSPKWQMLNKSVFQAKDLLNVNSSYILNPLKSVNTTFSEFAYTQFGGKKYFISDRLNPASGGNGSKWNSERYGWTGNGFLQVYQGKFDSLTMDFRSIGPANEFTGDLHFGPISLDSTFLFSTITPRSQKAKIGKWYEIIPKISFKNTASGKSQLIPASQENFLTDPFWDPKSQILYFAADFSGGFGDLDLYYSKFKSDTWEKPVNLGKTINSFGIERSPFVHQDTLYFSSDGLGGLGGLDIYKIALKEINGTQPVNLGVPFNSNKDDFFFFIDDDLSGLKFLSSDRDGGMGMDDIYFISKIPTDLIRNIFVKVFDEETGNSLENISVEFQRQSATLSQNLITNQKGIANFNINKLDSLINIKAYGSGYLNFIIEGFNVNNTDTIFVALQKLYLDTPIIFDDILYDFDQYTIRPSENESLVKLVSNLLANPNLNVELRSHTDSRGNESYNQKLSEKRSESVQNFLINGGVDKSRIFVRSFGESFPLINCGQNCSLNDHQRNRRTEIIFFYGGFKSSSYTYPSNISANQISVLSDSISKTGKNLNYPQKEDIQETETVKNVMPSSEIVGDSSFYYVVVGSFENLLAAKTRLKELNDLLGIKGFLISPMDEKNRFRVATERFSTLKMASSRKEYFKRKLRRNDIWILFLETEDSLLVMESDSF